MLSVIIALCSWWLLKGEILTLHKKEICQNLSLIYFLLNFEKKQNMGRENALRSFSVKCRMLTDFDLTLNENK